MNRLSNMARQTSSRLKTEDILREQRIGIATLLPARKKRIEAILI